MPDAFGHEFAAAPSAALAVLARATLLLLLALAAHAALGRRRALARSALWNGCLVGLLLLPAATLALPRLGVPAPAIEAIAPPEIPAVPDAVVMPESPDAPAMPFAGPLMPTFDGPAMPRFPGGTPITATEPTPGPAKPWRWPEPAALLAGAYLAVAALLAIRLAVSLTAIRRLVRDSEPVDEPAWNAAMGRWRAWLGIAGPVTLRRSTRVSVPVAVGWLCPAVILPEGLAASADPSVIDAAILHELCHVRRGDYGWNLLRKAVQIVYWPHPLTWPLGRIIGSVREQACDDLCVHALGGADAYRSALLAVASGLVRRPGPSLGLAMARRSGLGRRLAWVDHSRGAARCLLRRPARLALAGSALLAAMLAGSVEPARVDASDDPPPPEARQDGPKPAEAPGGPPDAVEITVLAHDTGKPLEGATIRSSADFERVILKSDAEGKARLDLATRRFRDSLSFDVWADGYVQQRYYFAESDARSPKIPREATVSLLPGEEILGGTVVDEEGRPVAGVKVEIWGYLGEKKDRHELAYMVDAVTDEQGRWRCRSFRSMTFAYLYLSHPDFLDDGTFDARRHGRPSPSDPEQPNEQPMAALRDFSDVQVMKRGVAISGTVVDAEGRPVPGAEVGWLRAEHRHTFHPDVPRTTTDAEGSFRFANVPPGRLVLQAKAPGHAPALEAIEAGPGAGPVAIRLGAPRTLSGRVEDTQGRPIPDAFVVVDTWRGYRSLGVYLKSDAEGRFRWDDAPPETVLINVNRTGFQGITFHSVPPDAGEVVLTLRRALEISGTVRDAANGERIEDARVEVGVLDPDAGEVRWASNSRASASQGNLQATLDAERAPEFRLRISARGYEPAESRLFRADEGQVEYDVRLSRLADGDEAFVSGVVRRPDGAPLAGARVALTYPLVGNPDRLPVVHIEDGVIRPGQVLEVTRTDAEGRFRLDREPDPAGRSFAVVVVHPDFYAEATRAEVEADPHIVARPWGRVEGVARAGGRPAAGAEIRYFADRLGNPYVPYISDRGQVTADAEGRFAIERVAPGDVRISGSSGEGPDRRGWGNGTLVEVEAGETARVELGGRGRPVVARIAPPEGFDPDADYTVHSEFQIESDRPRIPYPGELLARDDDSPVVWSKRWWASDEGRAYRRGWFELGQAKLQPDGSIRAEDVPPGDHVLRLSYSADRVRGIGMAPERVAYATKRFRVPEGDSREPVDLGVLRPKPRQTLKAGEPAPAFDVEALGGGRVRLGDFRGRYVLIHFWSARNPFSLSQAPELKEARDRFAADGRLAIVGLSLDADADAARASAAENGMDWPQGLVGNWPEGGVQEAYAVDRLPTLLLVDPEGKIRTLSFGRGTIAGAVAGAMDGP